MAKQSDGSRRRLAALAAVLLAAAACGRKKAPAGSGKLAPAAPSGDAPLTDTLAGNASVPAAEPLHEPGPAWTQEGPHFFNRDGHRFASAIGWAKTGNLALSRAAAEDQARAGLLRLLSGAPATGAAQGALPGARMTDSFTAKAGMVFVRMEVETTEQ